MGGSLIASIIAGVTLTVVAFAHSIGPALFLIGVTPFDAIPYQLFGVIGNLITFVPIIIFLARTNPGLWAQIFLSTRIQQGAFVLVLTLLVAHAAGILTVGFGEILNWLRFVTLFLMLGIFAYSLQKGEHVLILVKVMVTSMVLLTLLSALDFYLGIQILPVKVGQLSAGALDLEIESFERWRFTGAGFPVNRFANYLLPCTFLSVGWFMSVKSPLERLIAISCTGILVFAELLSVSRSGLLGMVIGAIILMPMAFGVGVRQLLSLLVIGGVFGVLISFGLEYTSAGDVLGKRFESDTLGGGTRGRYIRWLAAINIWAGSPFLGVGWGHFTFYSWRYIERGGLAAHNSYFKILAEAGLLSFIPLMYLIGSAFIRCLRKVERFAPDVEFWRPYFLCGMIAQLISMFFNDYFSERYFWLSLGFAAALERLTILDRLRALGERRKVVPSFEGRPLADAES